MPTNMSLFSVNAILVLSTDDRSRILTRYYSAPHAPLGHADTPGANPYPTVKEQKAFEKGLLEKTNKQASDVILYDGRVVVFKMEGDVMLYVVGGGDENEIMLFGVVLALRDALAILLKNSTDKRTLVENYDLLSLAVDEIVDDGIILETDPVIVSSRVTKPPTQDITSVKNIDLSEQGLLNAWEFGKSKLAERMRQL
ncbi:MAG: hypothetical protein Q9220_007501 [cf. Caloplaca sp. 1 TL-2023]